MDHLTGTKREEHVILGFEQINNQPHHHPPHGEINHHYYVWMNVHGFSPHLLCPLQCHFAAADPQLPPPPPPSTSNAPVASSASHARSGSLVSLLVFVTDFRRSPNKRRKATWVYKLFVFSIAQFIRVVIVSWTCLVPLRGSVSHVSLREVPPTSVHEDKYYNRRRIN